MKYKSLVHILKRLKKRLFPMKISLKHHLPDQLMLINKRQFLHKIQYKALF